MFSNLWLIASRLQIRALKRRELASTWLFEGIHKLELERHCR